MDAIQAVSYTHLDVYKRQYWRSKSKWDERKESETWNWNLLNYRNCI